MGGSGFDYQGLAGFLAGTLGITVVFMPAIRSGLARRLVDPGMMMVQVAVAGGDRIDVSG